MVNPASLATMVGVLGAYAASHAVGIGIIADAVMAVGAGALIGWQAVTAAKDLWGFAQFVNATTEEELDKAGQHLANFVTTVGIDIVIGILTKRAAGKIKGAGSGGRENRLLDRDLVESSGRSSQNYTNDLSHVTGKGAKARQRAIDSILKEDFENLNFTYKPEYSPFIRTGIAKNNAGTQIGKNMFSSRNQLRDTIIHEELHHRWWKRGLRDHHPMNSVKEKKFYETIDRYIRIRGWK